MELHGIGGAECGEDNTLSQVYPSQVDLGDEADYEVTDNGSGNYAGTEAGTTDGTYGTSVASAHHHWSNNSDGTGEQSHAWSMDGYQAQQYGSPMSTSTGNFTQGATAGETPNSYTTEDGAYVPHASAFVGPVGTEPRVDREASPEVQPGDSFSNRNSPEDRQVYDIHSEAQLAGNGNVLSCGFCEFWTDLRDVDGWATHVSQHDAYVATDTHTCEFCRREFKPEGRRTSRRHIRHFLRHWLECSRTSMVEAGGVSNAHGRDRHGRRWGR